MLEIIEICYNKMMRVPKVKSIPYSFAHKVLSVVPHHHGFTRWMSMNELQETRLNLVVGDNALGFEDLMIRPLSFPNNVKRILIDQVARGDPTMDELNHGWAGHHDREFDP